MSPDRTCPDCGETLERMTLRAPDVVGEITVVSEADDGLLSGIRADEVLDPVPHVCPSCRRILFYAEE